MRKSMKKIVVSLLIVFVAIGSNGMQVDARERIEADGEEPNYMLGYIVPTASTYSFADQGVVITDGLNLRKEPNSSSTILGVMYFGEVVKVDLENSTATYYYIERNEPKTKGYASKEYIQIAGYAR